MKIFLGLFKISQTRNAAVKRPTHHRISCLTQSVRSIGKVCGVPSLGAIFIRKICGRVTFPFKNGVKRVGV